MQHKLLNNLATVRSGYPFRDRLTHDAQGNVRVLQIRDLRSHLTPLAENLLLIKAPESAAARPLQPGDVVIPARGDHYHAVNFNLHEPTIASSQLLMLRATSPEILPQYLCWALNQPEAQHALRNATRGTSMPLLSRESLGEIDIPLPSLATQRKIIELQELWEREQQLTQQLLNNREAMLKGMVQKLMTRDTA